MARKRLPAPSYEEIAAAQSELVATLPNAEPGMEAICCWACGHWYDGDLPERAHLISYKHGGSNEPRNFILLCGRCHAEQPDAATRSTQLSWLRNHPSQVERLMPVIGSLLKSIKQASAEYGSEELVGQFSAYLMTPEGAALLSRQKIDTAGVRYSQVSSNGMWSLVDIFHKWARARQIQPGGQLVLIHPESTTRH